MSFKVQQSNPAATTADDLYTVPAAKEAVISTLAVAEHGGAPAEFSLKIRPAGASAADEHILVSAAELAAYDTQFFTIGIALATTDVITVEATTADVTFTAFVNEQDI